MLQKSAISNPPTFWITDLSTVCGLDKGQFYEQGTNYVIMAGQPTPLKKYFARSNCFVLGFCLEKKSDPEWIIFLGTPNWDMLLQWRRDWCTP